MRTIGIRFGLAVVLMALALAGCSGNKSKSSVSTTKPDLSGSVNTASSDFGEILVDSHGMTLYGSVKDVPDLSSCTGACAQTWPPLSGDMEVGKGLSMWNLTQITRPDGIKQLVYNGHPLYLWEGDKKPGDTTGHNVSGFFAISNEGEQIKKK